MTDKKRTVFVTEAAREAVRRGKEHAYSPSDNVESKPASPSESARELAREIASYDPSVCSAAEIAAALIESSWAQIEARVRAECVERAIAWVERYGGVDPTHMDDDLSHLEAAILAQSKEESR